jgi:small ligand-binding sensory domain FIST
VTRCASALSTHPVASVATGEVAGAVLESLGAEPDLVVLFATRPHTGAVEDVAAAVRELLRPATFIGATAVSLAGGSQEVEEEPALSLLAVRFDGGGPAVPVRLEAIGTGDGATVLGLPDTSEPGSTLVVLADPFSFPVQELLDAVADDRPDLTVVGGLASAAFAAGGNRLLLDGVVHDDGAVGVLLPPGVATTAVVSQGCRPIGTPMVVTGSSGNMLESLASEPALPLLLRLVESLSPADRTLAASGGLQFGRVVDERAESHGPGDFLVRTVLGAVKERNAVAVGDQVPVGTTVQFQVRDAGTADHELRAMLAGTTAAGALLFTCNGRGVHLFTEPHHDARLVAEAASGAVAGMFCAGEIGPVGGRPFVHGYTASVLLFDPGPDPG